MNTNAVHTTTLTATSPITGREISRTIVWADRHYSLCRRCGQHIGHQVPNCPVSLNPGRGSAAGQIEAFDQACGNCGQWNHVAWEVVVGASVEDVAQRTFNDLANRTMLERMRIAALLVAAIEAAKISLSEQLDDGETVEDRIAEVCTGSDSTPGVCWDNGKISAWAEGPVGDEPIIVHA